MKSFIPLCVDVSEARVVMVGGGRVALQKLRTLGDYAGNLVVCAPEILPEIRDMPVQCIESGYTPEVLAGARLVYACTGDRDLNRRIGVDAREIGALANVVDDPENCDFISPAISRHQHMSVAVSSNGRHVKQSLAWRDAIQKFIRDTLAGSR